MKTVPCVISVDSKNALGLSTQLNVTHIMSMHVQMGQCFLLAISVFQHYHVDGENAMKTVC